MLFGGPKTGAQKREAMETMYAKVRAGAPEVPEITADDVLARRASDDLVLVDVRTPEEQAVSMIEGAVTVEAFEADRAAYADRPVVVYCTIGGRSGKYAQRLHAEGVNVTNMAGAILAWTHAGGALVDPDGNPTKRVHTHSSRFGLTADGYEPVW